MSRLWLIGGAAFVGVLLVASIVIAVARQPSPLAEGTPERTVQLFLKALRDEDFKSAYGLLSTDRRTECTVEEFAFRGLDGRQELRDSRVTLKDTKPLNGSTIVASRVTRVQSRGPFGTSEYTHEQSFTLVREDGRWSVDQYTWPYFGCGNPRFPQPAVPKPVAPAGPPSATPTATTTASGAPDATKGRSTP
jgi:hypothetical protein